MILDKKKNYVGTQIPHNKDVFTISVTLQWLFIITITIIVSLFSYLGYKVHQLENKNLQLLKIIKNMEVKNNELLSKINELSQQNVELQKAIQILIEQNKTQVVEAVTRSTTNKFSFLETMISNPYFWVCVTTIIVGGLGSYYLADLYSNSALGIFVNHANNATKNLMAKCGIGSTHTQTYDFVDGAMNSYTVAILKGVRGNSTISVSIKTPESDVPILLVDYIKTLVENANASAVRIAELSGKVAVQDRQIKELTNTGIQTIGENLSHIELFNQSMANAANFF